MNLEDRVHKHPPATKLEPNNQDRSDQTSINTKVVKHTSLTMIRAIKHKAYQLLNVINNNDFRLNTTTYIENARNIKRPDHQHNKPTPQPTKTVGITQTVAAGKKGPSHKHARTSTPHPTRGKRYKKNTTTLTTTYHTGTPKTHHRQHKKPQRKY
jgi:hypothetical protein